MTPKIQHPSTQRNPILHWLALISWGLIVLAHLILFLFGLKLDYSHMLVPCAGGWGAGCNPMAISAAEVAVLSSWGLTIRAYALAMTPVYVVLLLVYWVLGGLILWRQGTSRLGLAVSLASMWERAEELGGRCAVVSNGQSGTQVRAVLPFSANGVAL